MSNRQKHLVFYGLPLAFLAVLILAGILYVDHLQADATRLAETGKATQQLLGQYKKAFKKLEIDDIAACYDDRYISEHGGFWVQRLQSERDGVRVYTWDLEDLRPFHKPDVTEQISRFIRNIRSIEQSAYKLDAVEQIPNPESAVVRAFLWLRGTNTEEEAFESKVQFRLCLSQ